MIVINLLIMFTINWLNLSMYKKRNSSQRKTVWKHRNSSSFVNDKENLIWTDGCSCSLSRRFCLARFGSVDRGETLRFCSYGPVVDELLLVAVTHFYTASESAHKPQQLLSSMTWLVRTIHVGLINSVFHRHRRLNSPRLRSHWDAGKSLDGESV